MSRVRPILAKAHRLNRARLQFSPDKKPIQILLGFSPGGLFQNHLSTFLTFVLDISNDYDHLVATVLLDYTSVPIGPLYESRMTKSLEICQEKSNSTFQCGFIFNVQHCRDQFTFLEKLHPTKPTPIYYSFNITSSLPREIQKAWPYIRKLRGLENIIPGLKYPEKLYIDNAKKQYTLNPAYAMERKAQHILDVEVTGYDTSKKRTWKCSRDDHQYENTIVVDILPEDLYSLVTSDNDLKLKNVAYNESFLNTFDKFLVKIEIVRNASTSSFTFKMLNAVAEYNNITKGNRRPLDLWLSFIPKADIAGDLSGIISYIKIINNTFPNTVSSILLNYGELRIDPNAYTLIRHDIITCNRLLFELIRDENLIISCGFAFDSRNCESSSRYLESLPFKRYNKVVLYPVDRTNAKFPLSRIRMEELPCQNFQPKGPKKVVQLPDWGNIRIDFENRSYSYDEKILERIGNTYMPQYIVWAESNTPTAKNSKSAHFFKITRQWIETPVLFNGEHFGVSITHNNDRNQFSKLFNHFGMVLVVPSNDSQINTDIARYAVSSGIQINVLPCLSAKGLVNDTRSTDMIIKDIKSATILQPSVIKFILFEWANCLGTHDCTDKDHYELVPYFRSRYEDFEAVHTLVSQALPGTRLGVVVDSYFLTYLVYRYDIDLDLTQITAHARTAFRRFKTIDSFMFKIDVDVGLIRKEGSYQAVQVVTKLLEEGTAILSMVFELPKQHSSTSFLYQIRMTGCTGLKETLQTSTEVVRFWEIMNNWAVVMNKTVVMEAAFEESCVKNASHTCGWFQVTKKCGDANRNDEGPQIFIDDIKSISLKRFQQDHGQQPNATPDNTLDNSLLYVTLTIAIVFIILGSLVIPILVLKYQEKFHLSKKQIKQVLHGNESALKSSFSLYDKSSLELPAKCFQIDTNDVIGHGESGTRIVKGIVKGSQGDWIPAAIKMHKRQTGTRARDPTNIFILSALMSEAKVLSYIGSHKNVIQLLGVFTGNLRKGDISVFLQYCERGSLDAYLKCIHKKAKQVEGVYQNLNTPMKEEVDKDLERWTVEITYGMEYLASKKIVHGDLAARNVLLDSDKTAKISDFGLSRRLEAYSNYYKTNDEPLPWRWMPPESLRKKVFNEKTDVWSLGVTIWEMYSLGEIPYGGFFWSPSFISILEGGMRLDKPDNMSKPLFDLLLKCWEISPRERPSFSKLMELLSEKNSILPKYEHDLKTS